eukprot:CAMPEP_0184720070 /NCGR_PEP_ID=MMETSP0314-20130426/9823_1 /TAXON_ID=38298 /ORGANISM="Rhodella maculata, Strain CCMP 736" /LENGTH=112 /DNA_ID=CAMNT_0027184055 /DNA_START=29 /DNA_END=367 /DNA_ORIENTATION=-
MSPDTTTSPPSTQTEQPIIAPQPTPRLFAIGSASVFAAAPSTAEDPSAPRNQVAVVRCPTCNAGFENRKKVAVHVRDAHAGLKKFGCEKCPGRFLSLANRRCHCIAAHGMIA